MSRATQGVLSNVVAGLSIIFTKPFRIGEYISIAGEEGVVSNITLFNTTLTHVDHSRVVIPNRKIVGERRLSPDRRAFGRGIAAVSPQSTQLHPVIRHPAPVFTSVTAALALSLLGLPFILLVNVTGNVT